MKVKEQVLLILKSNKGKFVSGEEIANSLFVSRNAIWKAINSLRADGFTIDAVQNKGYMLTSDGYISDNTEYCRLRILQQLKRNKRWNFKERKETISWKEILEKHV